MARNIPAQAVQPEVLYIIETRHEAFAKYEQAVLSGYTFDPAEPPVTLPTGYAIIQMIRRTATA